MNKKKIKVGYQPNKINQPTFLKPPSTGSGIGTNPSTKCEKSQGGSRLPKQRDIALVDYMTTLDEVIDKIKFKRIQEECLPDKIFDYILVQPDCNYPVTGGKGIENSFEIKYTLFGIRKSFAAKVNKNVLTNQDIKSLILEHEMNDYIKCCKCEDTESKKQTIDVKSIISHSEWIEERIDEITKVMDRYREAGEEIPKEWYFELARFEVYKNKTLQNTINLTINTNEITEETMKKIEDTFKYVPKNVIGKFS